MYIPYALLCSAEMPDQAQSNNVQVCSKRGLHSLHLLPFFPALQSHLDALETMPQPSFSKPPHLGSLHEGQEALEDACQLKYGIMLERSAANGWDADWRVKVRMGYERLTQTLWRVSREFDVRGYGTLLREKLTTKWCDCGCSTDHLGEVCERTVREDEEANGVRIGKQREWDGRGTGVFGWETEEEEDIWEMDLDFGGLEPGQGGAASGDANGGMTIADMMEWRFFKAEREKEEVWLFSHLQISSFFFSSMVVCRATSLFVEVITRWLPNIMRLRMGSSPSYPIINSTSPQRTSN